MTTITPESELIRRSAIQPIRALLGSRPFRGILLVLLSAISFGAVTPFARLAYDDGVNVTTLMVTRYALAALAVGGYLAWKRQPWRLAGRRLWLTLATAVFLGLLSFAYMGSVQFIPVSLAALIYYTYPIMVTVLGHVTGMEKMSGRDRTARFFVIGGQALSLGGLALLLGLSWSALNGLGVLLALFAAFSFALVLLFGSRLMQEVPPMVLNLYVAVVNVILFMAVALLGKGFIWPTVTTGWAGLLGVAVFFVLGFMGLFVGVRLVGAGRAACLTNIEPVVTIALAITLLSEPLGAGQIMGATAVLIGIYIMCRHLLTERDSPDEKELQQIKRLLQAIYCTPGCRQGSGCSLADGERYE